MIGKATRRASILAILLTLAMMLTTAPAFARGPGGGSGGGSGGSGGSGAPVPMTRVYAPTGTTATIGFTTSRGYGSATMRITANLPLPTTTCDIPYAVDLTGTTYTTKVEIHEYFANLTSETGEPAPIVYPKVMFVAGTGIASYTCADSGTTTAWTFYNSNGDVIGTAVGGDIHEFGYNQDFAQGFIGSSTDAVRVIDTTASATLFKYGPVTLAVRVNPNRPAGGGEEGGGGGGGGHGGSGGHGE